MPRPTISLALVFLALLVASGCDSPPPRPATPATTPSDLPPPPDETATAEEEPAEEPPQYVYSPVGKRDPFRSPFRTFVAPAPTDDRPNVPLQPLQKWDVEQLTLRATITGTSDPTVMLVDPEGKGHVARRGSLIGKNWGKITAIKRDCIVITEQLRDATGAVSSARQQKCLPQTEREKKMEEQLF